MILYDHSDDGDDDNGYDDHDNDLGDDQDDHSNDDDDNDDHDYDYGDVYTQVEAIWFLFDDAAPAQGLDFIIIVVKIIIIRSS